MREMRFNRWLKPIVVVALLSGFFVPNRTQAEPMRDFVLSCSYGVLAGTLVGAATLAFSDKPGDSLNKVARGASFGLYAGILLGVYVVYGVSDKSEDDVRSLGQLSAPRSSVPNLPPVLITPLISEQNELVGAEVRYEVSRF